MKINRLLAALVAGIAVLATAVYAYADDNRQDRGSWHFTSNQKSTFDEIKKTGTLKVCTTGDYRPFTYLDPQTNEFSGIDIDMAKNLASKLQVEIEFVQTTWSTLLADFTAGKCHIAMGGISINTPRAEQVFFSDPYLRNGKAPITRCENVDRFQTIVDINQPDVRVIANPGGTNESFARANFPNAQLIIHPDNNTIHDQIVLGNADVMVTDASETKYQQKLHPELCAVHPDEQFTFTENGYMLPQGDVEFEHYVNTWLRIAMNDGTYASASAIWFE